MMKSNLVCVDASLALKWLLVSQKEAVSDSLLRDWNANNFEFVCPPLFHPEITTGIRKQVYFKQISSEAGEEAFQAYLTLPISEIGGTSVYRKAWELAKKINLPRTYDMQYLAVAELEDCELWTADERLFNACSGKNKRIRWIGELAGA